MATVADTKRAEVQGKCDDAHFAIHAANRALIRRDWSQLCYVEGRAALDNVMLHLEKAKWLFGTSVGSYAGYLEKTGSDDDLRAAAETFDYIVFRADEIREALGRGEVPSAPQLPDIPVTREGTEIPHADGIPIAPASCPVVVLRGSNRDMGRQYVKQLLEIFGTFILDWHSKRPISDSELTQIQRWEAELQSHAPDILEFAAGLSEGATGSGVPIDYVRALAIFTGVWAPVREALPLALAQSTSANSDALAATYLGVSSSSGKKPETPSPCSGAFGWGEATTDGALVGAASQDHDGTFQVTIVAYPELGNSFILTPFAANGTIPVLGHHHMSGHPGMNSKGVAYVHHGGANMGEPKDEWGYGLRRGAAVMHMLQFCDTAREALEYMLGLPVGDTASTLGTVGGMFADSEYGFSLEARPGAPNPTHPIIREHTFDEGDKPLQVLYGTNNALAPESSKLNGAPTSGKGYDYTREGGWFTFDPEVVDAGTKGEAIKRRMTRSSEGRNRYLYHVLTSAYGSIDVDYATLMYRVSGTEEDELAAASGNGDGSHYDLSAAHRGNAFVAVLKPDNGPNGIYRACVGPANRALAANLGGHGYYYYDETASFWELTLDETPTNALYIALRLALTKITQAEGALASVDSEFAGTAKLSAMLDEARASAEQAKKIVSDLDGAEGDDEIAAVSRALRRAHWGQIRADQVLNAVSAPPSDID